MKTDTPDYALVDYIMLAVGGLCAIALAVAGLFIWQGMPERVPTHFGLDGTADGWGPRISVLIMPLVGLGLWAMMAILSRFPKLYNFPVPVTDANRQTLYLLGRRMLLVMGVEIVLLYGGILWMTVRAAHNLPPGGVAVVTPVGLFALLATVAVFLVLMFRAR